MKKIFCIIGLGLAILACEKTVTQPKSGIFRGVFEMTGTNGGGFETGDCSISLNDVTGSYSLSVDTTSAYPLGSGGTYLVVDATKMSFIATTPRDTSALINQHLYLDTTYNYTFDDNIFELKKQVDTVLYEYRFVRY